MKKYLVCHCCSYNAPEFTLIVRVNKESEGEELAKKINESTNKNPGEQADKEVKDLLLSYLDDSFIIDDLAHYGNHMHKACLGSFANIRYINWAVF